MRAAFLAGALSRSKVRELIRVTMPDTDAGWAAFARGRSVRQLKAAIAAWKQREEPNAPAEDPDEQDDARRVRFRCTQVEAAIWRGWGRAMMRDVLGRSVPDHVMAETLNCCEVASEVSSGGIREAHITDSGGRPLTPRSGGSRPRKNRRLSSRQLARHARRRKLFESPSGPPIPSSEGCTDSWQHLRVVRQIQRMRHGLAWERSRVLSIFQARGFHRLLGVSAHEHVEYVLGLSPKDVQHALELQSRLALLPQLSVAWREGVLAEREVRVLSSIATRETESAWIAHAARCSRTRLESEVDWHLAIRATLPWPAYLAGLGGLPVDGPVSAARFELDWRELFGCRERERQRLRRVGASSALAPADEPAIDDDASADLEPDAAWHLHRSVLISFEASGSVAEMWWLAVAATRWLLGDATSDAEGNLTTLCDACHRLLHSGRIALEGRAPDGLILSISPGSGSGGAPREQWAGGLLLEEVAA